jgi:pyrimidine operon attenuation protein/uracil phosphoribosyltransferase
MMNSIARAELALQNNDHFSALQIVDQGIQRTGKFCGECLRENQGQAENMTREHYLNNLIEYRSDLESVSESLSREENESTRAENDEDTIIQELEDLLQEMAGD